MTIRHRNSNKHAPRATQVLPSSGDTPVFLASASTLVLLSSPLVVEDEEPKAFNLDGKSEDEKGVILTPHHFQWQRLKFPHRLFHLLNLMEREELSTLAHWNEKGTSFRVPKSKELVDNFLPYFFQQNKWKSFQRQLNVYDFKRIESGPLKGYYYHPFFVRSNIDLAHKIRRQKQKNEHVPFMSNSSPPVHSMVTKKKDNGADLSSSSLDEISMAPRALPRFFSSSIQAKNAPPLSSSGDSSRKNEDIMQPGFMADHHRPHRSSRSNMDKLTFAGGPSPPFSWFNCWSSSITDWSNKEQFPPPAATTSNGDQTRIHTSGDHASSYIWSDFKFLETFDWGEFASEEGQVSNPRPIRVHEETLTRSESNASCSSSSSLLLTADEDDDVEDDDECSLGTIDDLSDLMTYSSSEK